MVIPKVTFGPLRYYGVCLDCNYAGFELFDSTFGGAFLLIYQCSFLVF